MIFHDFQVCSPSMSWVEGSMNRRKCPIFRDKSASNFFSIVLTVKPFQHGLGITKGYFQLNFHDNSTHNFYGAQTESFFFMFFTLSNYKGIVEQTESPPESWVADHRTATAVTFSLFEL